METIPIMELLEKMEDEMDVADAKIALEEVEKEGTISLEEMKKRMKL